MHRPARVQERPSFRDNLDLSEPGTCPSCNSVHPYKIVLSRSREGIRINDCECAICNSRWTRIDFPNRQNQWRR